MNRKDREKGHPNNVKPVSYYKGPKPKPRATHNNHHLPGPVNQTSPLEQIASDAGVSDRDLRGGGIPPHLRLDTGYRPEVRDEPVRYINRPAVNVTRELTVTGDPFTASLNQYGVLGDVYIGRSSDGKTVYVDTQRETPAMRGTIRDVVAQGDSVLVTKLLQISL